jgi:hypothetical protein
LGKNFIAIVIQIGADHREAHAENIRRLEEEFVRTVIEGSRRRRDRARGRRRRSRRRRRRKKSRWVMWR